MTIICLDGNGAVVRTRCKKIEISQANPSLVIADEGVKVINVTDVISIVER